MIRDRRVWFVLFVFTALTGCPDTTHVSTDHCDHVGDACRLPSGPLGVCSESLAATCASPPCIACTSQH